MQKVHLMLCSTVRSDSQQAKSNAESFAVGVTHVSFR